MSSVGLLFLSSSVFVCCCPFPSCRPALMKQKQSQNATKVKNEQFQDATKFHNEHFFQDATKVQTMSNFKVQHK